jgi:hypothetical protein
VQRPVSASDFEALARGPAEPCLSFYAPISHAPRREITEARRFGSLVSEAAEGLAEAGVEPGQIDTWCDSLVGLQATRRLSGASRGVAAFLGPDRQQAFRLVVPPEPRVVVADYFALRELLYQAGLEGRVSWPEGSPGSDEVVVELDRILNAAVHHRIRRLWTRQRFAIPGALDSRTGRLVAGGGGDVLEALTTLVLRDGGQAYNVPREQVPRLAAVAAQLSPR